MLTAPKPFIFVLMPFDSSFNDVYQLGIKAACEMAGAYCERVDEQIFQESILDRIYTQISKADIIISDMTDRNPNVFYETGYAHALGKRVILLTSKADDIPFDLKHYPHIVYQSSITTLKNDLQRRIEWHTSNPLKGTIVSRETLLVLVNGQDLSGNSLMQGEFVQDRGISYGDGSISFSSELNFNIQNKSRITLGADKMKIFILSQKNVYSDENTGISRPQMMHDEWKRYQISVPQVLFPDDWLTCTFRFSLRIPCYKEGNKAINAPFKFSVLSDIGQSSYEFTVQQTPV